MIKDILNKYAADFLECPVSLFSKHTESPIILERDNNLRCPDGRPMPFIAFDNGYAQVFSVHHLLAKSLRETIFLCTHWSKHRLDLHDVAFFDDEYLPRVQKMTPGNWSKIIHMYCTANMFRPAPQLHKIQQKLHISDSKKEGWIKDAEFYIIWKLRKQDSHSKTRIVSEPVSIVEVMGKSSVAQISVGTNYEFRGQGMARSLVSDATQYILKTGRIPIYGVASENFGSIALANSLGFRRFGKTLAYLGKIKSFPKCYKK